MMEIWGRKNIDIIQNVLLYILFLVISLITIIQDETKRIRPEINRNLENSHCCILAKAHKINITLFPITKIHTV